MDAIASKDQVVAFLADLRCQYGTPATSKSKTTAQPVPLALAPED